jgi:hypothetical protein
VYNGDQLLALIWPNVPVQTSMLFIPKSVVQWLESMGSVFKFGVGVRTNDGRNRSRSKTITVSDLLTTVAKKKQVVVVPMF